MSPSVATVAYTLSPAAKLTATIRPASSEPPNFMPASISGLGLLGQYPENGKGPPSATLAINPVPFGYRVDSISKPQASSNGSGMYLEFLLRRAHSRSRVDGKYWSGESLYSLTTCSNSVTVGIIGPIGSGFPQFRFPRRFAINDCLVPGLSR